MKKRFSQQRETKVEIVAPKIQQEKKRGEVFVVEMNSAPAVKEDEKRKPKGVAFTVDLDGQNDQDVDQLNEQYEQFFRKVQQEESKQSTEASDVQQQSDDDDQYYEEDFHDLILEAAKAEADNDNERVEEEDDSIVTPMSDPQKPEISAITRQPSTDNHKSQDQVSPTKSTHKQQ